MKAIPVDRLEKNILDSKDVFIATILKRSFSMEHKEKCEMVSRECCNDCKDEAVATCMTCEPGDDCKTMCEGCCDSCKERCVQICELEKKPE